MEGTFINTPVHIGKLRLRAVKTFNQNHKAHKPSGPHFEPDLPGPKPLATPLFLQEVTKHLFWVFVEVGGEGRRDCLPFHVYRGEGNSLRVTVTHSPG